MASNWARPSASVAESTGDGKHFTSFFSTNLVNAVFAVETSSGVRDVLAVTASARRCDSRALRMILSSAHSAIAVRLADLVINVRDVHDKVDVVAEVISQDASDNILSEVITGFSLSGEERSPSMAHMRRVVHRWAAVVPVNLPPLGRDELLLRVSEGYSRNPPWCVSANYKLSARDLRRLVSA